MGSEWQGVPSGWASVELRKLVEISIDKIETKSIPDKCYISTDTMLPDFGGVSFNSATPSVAKTLLFSKEDILFSNIRTYFRKLWIADRNGGCSNDVIVFRPKECVHPRFLFYSMMEERFIQHTVQTSKGTKMPRGDKSAMLQYKTTLPPLPEQKAIAHILGSLDDKIELNRRMNATLEGMAQALFQSWFVDFDPVIDNALAAGNEIPEELQARAEIRRKALADGNANREAAKDFPDSFIETKEMGWIPRGWGVKTLSDFGKVITGKTPPKEIENAYCNSGLPFITPTDVDDSMFVFSTNRFLSGKGQETVKNSKVEAGSICVTCIGSQMGKTSIAPFDSYTNQQINTITGCEQKLRNFLFFNLRRRREEIFLKGSSGSTMPIINKSSFEKLNVLFPSDKLLSTVSDRFQNILDSILQNTGMNVTLSNLRDTLLPKLLSGELRVGDVERMVRVG
ncbi:restriction endonuclease subunit S [Candidatus Haliotispira prima]|uniref:Restriction endonuclease subunit S n=1 Tax=Candidatus Haliotispira prima TaxID=3034016 RepID=A0ABY8MEH3_9SPIO|nr:restriction endonuclease subunit S [Candidatus Haliotispira prima]